MEPRREFIDMMAARLEELDREISKLENIADKAVAEVKAEYHQQIHNLFLRKEEMQDKVTKIGEASGNAWEDMKAGTDLSWEVFENSLKSPMKKKTKYIRRAIK